MGAVPDINSDDRKLQINEIQLRLQIFQVILSSVLVYYIVKNSMKKQNLPDSFIDIDEED